MTPHILKEEYDELNEQDVVDEELAAQLTEDEEHLEAYLNQDPTTDSPFEDISEQQEENNIVK